MSYAVGDAIALVIIIGLPVVTLGVLVWWLRRHHGRFPERPTWRQLLIGNGLLVFGVVSILLLCGEVYYRYIFDATESFGLGRTTQAWFARHYQLNKSGFRDSVAEYPRARTVGKRRLLIVGDSFTAGQGIKKVDDRFGNLLRPALPDWEIYITAQCGFDTPEEIMLLKYLINVRCQADAVLLVYCLNDINRIVAKNPAIEAVGHHQNDLAAVYRHSYFVNTLYGRLQVYHTPALQDYYGFVKQAYFTDDWRRHEEQLDLLGELASKHYGKMLVVTFPFLHNLGEHYDYEAVHEKMADHWRSRGTPHLDLLPVFRSIPAQELVINPRDAHPNEHAHRLAAAAIAPFLKHQLVDSPPAP